MFFYDLKMHFSYKNITFMHENVSHCIKWILCVHNLSEYLLRKILIDEKLFYM